MITLGLDLPPMSQINRDREAAEKKAARSRTYKRRYDGARGSRLTADWQAAFSSANFEIRTSLRMLRARVRDLARNDDLVKHFLSLCRTNIVGPTGIRFQLKPPDPANPVMAKTAAEVEKAWRDFSQPAYCSASGKLSFTRILTTAVTNLARDGEAIIRMLPADNPFGLSLKVIDAMWLDETYSEERTNGNRIIMSVEVDKNDRPVAYWLTPTRDQFIASDLRRGPFRTRVPAEEIIHLYLVDEDESQTRGVPWVHTAITTIKQLKEYRMAEVVAARVGASKMAVAIPGAEDELADGPEEDPTPQPLPDYVEAGQIMQLAPGSTFETFDPKHPNSGMGEFMRHMVRSLSCGLNVSYPALSNDLENINLSSIRFGLREEQAVWRSMQTLIVDHICRPIYQKWLLSCLLTGRLAFASAFYEWCSDPRFRPRGWASMDPLKDTQNAVLSIGNGLASRTSVLAEQGEDYEDVLADLAREQEMAAAAGVKVSGGLPSATNLNEQDSEEKPAKSNKGKPAQAEDGEED